MFDQREHSQALSINGSFRRHHRMEAFHMSKWKHFTEHHRSMEAFAIVFSARAEV